MTRLSPLVALTIVAPGVASAQVPYDPPTAVRAAPNVMVLLDATRTTLINGETCRGVCHVEGNNCGAHNGEYSCDIYRNGETRLQLARRVLTGGWGWNTNVTSQSGEIADARVRSDGVMDAYKVRWGVAWYDGVGTRIVVDPTENNELAQQRVIDFGLASNESLGAGIGLTGGQSLNSWLPYYRTTNCCSNSSSPQSDSDAALAPARQARALDYIRQYWQPGVSPPRFPGVTLGPDRWAGSGDSTTHIIEPAPITPGDTRVIDGDTDNVLVTAPSAGGCRRNFTIMLLDGHGGGSYDHDNDANTPNLTNGAAAAAIYRLPGGGGVDLETNGRRNNSSQVFAIHFGVQDKHHADRIADTGFDGIECNNPTAAATPNGCSGTACQGCDGMFEAFAGAPGGEIRDLTPMLAAFSAVMGLVLDGTYTGAAPAITRFGDFLISSSFEIRSCEGIAPTQCNIGRPGEVRMRPINADGTLGLPAWSAGVNLRARDHRNRDLLTGVPSGTTQPTDTNCGPYATCTVTTRAAMTPIPDPSDRSEYATRPLFRNQVTTPAMWNGSGLTYNDLSFIRGDPLAKFANGVFRGDVACDALTTDPSLPSACCVDQSIGCLAGLSCGDGIPDGFESDPYSATCLDDRYKLADVANSKPVVVDAPPGIGEDLTRWRHFLDTEIARSGQHITAFTGAPSTAPTVSERDRVVYIGGNDGLLHAFLGGRAIERTANNPGNPGRVVDYGPIGTTCGSSRQWCDGLELWAYSPRFLQSAWPSMTGGHFFMVDGSPVVTDVLFTNGRGQPNPVAQMCNQHSSNGACDDWQYRTVLMQCLGAGGPGCFALDVTNPYNPQLLWERTFSNLTSLRGTSTSRPQVVRVKRTVTENGVQFDIPYYVAVMGGGLNEQSTASQRRGSVIVVGLEDGRYWFTGPNAEADFAGSPTCLDTNNDSFADTCYMATTSASLYKIRFADGDPSQGIGMVKWFDGRDAIDVEHNDSTSDIRTYHRVTATFDLAGRINLFYGTGNFEDVTNANEQNYFFKVLDPEPSAPLPNLWNRGLNNQRMTGSCDSQISSSNSSFGIGNSGRGALRLATGEKVIFDPVLANKVVFFTSYQPANSLCVRGDGHLYGIRYDNCRNGVDTNGDGEPNTDKVSFTGSAGGLPTAPVVNEQTGNVYVTLDNSNVNATSASAPESAETPMIKLWWREVIR